MGFRSLPRKTVAALACSTVLVTATLTPLPAFAQVDAKASLASGDKAAKAKDWATAAKDYEAANKAAPSADALEGLANAQYQQKRDGDAYASYDEWKKKYGGSAAKPKTTTVDARLKELEGRTGLLAIDVAEPGATITVDDKPMGTTPVAAPLRLGLGPHHVRVTKTGLSPIDQTPNVTASVTATLSGKMEAQGTKGRISVKEKTGKPIRVTLDGVDMGDAPWSGETEAGPHEIGGRAGAIAAVPEKITVEAGKTRDVELVASATSAPLKVNTSDGKGLIYFDGKLVGEGTFVGDVPAGPHQLKVTREGYDPFEEQLVLKDKEALARSVTLKLSSKIETNEVAKEGRRIEGIYGGFGLMLSFLPSGLGSSMAKTCATPPQELAGCDGGDSTTGGGLTGFVGYHWDVVGVELYGGGQYDTGSTTLNWVAASTDPGFGPDPARKEEFHVHRLGGFGAFRIRMTFQSEKVRFSVAGGVGLSYRSVLLTRDTTPTAGGSVDKFVPDAEGYLSPVLSLEPSVQLRLTPRTAVYLALTMLVESPNAFDSIPTTPAQGGHFIGAKPPTTPGVGVSTPAYTLASQTQVFIGPTLGMMFGP